MDFNDGFRQHQRGVSLIEAVVATLVLGVAVLGYAGLEVTGLRTTNEAFLRENATYLAIEAKERIRMNRAQNEFYLTTSNWVTTGTASCGAGSADCTSDQVAVHDISELTQLAADYLPNGAIGVTSCGTTNDFENCIMVSWASTTISTCDPDSATASNTNCIEVVVYDF